MHFKIRFIALLLLSTAAHTQAATTATLTVTGTVSPPTCDVSIPSSALDLGVMPSFRVASYPLKDNVAYTVPARSVALTITCDGALPFALNFSDNKVAGKPVIGADTAYYYGLGTIGAYSLKFTDLTVIDSASATKKPAGYLYRAKASVGAWSIASTVPDSTLFKPDNYLGFRAAGNETTPSALRGISGTLSVQPYLMKTLVDGIATDIKLDGSATITLQYV